MIKSFTSANEIPVKLFLNEGIVKLRPIHVQWIPTNRCNLNCNYCSCSKRQYDLEMDFSVAYQVIEELAMLGCKAVTITGGGEPLLHPQIRQMIEQFNYFGIAIGLVTNGLLLDCLDEYTRPLLTWCRISNGDDRELTSDYYKILERAVTAEVDWAFSHVVSYQPNFNEIHRIVNFAREHEFTHVRLVSDILDADNVNLNSVREHLKEIDELVIYQDRSNPKCWSGDCWIGYIKPVIGPDWSIYPCCGVQYASDPPSLDLSLSMVIGNALTLSEMYEELNAFRFSCKRCYYTAYNEILSAIQSNLQHIEFI